MNIDDRRRIEMDALREYHAIVCGMGAQNFTFEGCWRSYRQNMRGVVTTLSVAVQNAVPYRDVGVATAGLQFCRSPHAYPLCHCEERSDVAISLN